MWSAEAVRTEPGAIRTIGRDDPAWRARMNMFRAAFAVIEFFLLGVVVADAAPPGLRSGPIGLLTIGGADVRGGLQSVSFQSEERGYGHMKQIVLITGGTAGIGLGLAEAFLSQGAAVAVCGRSTAALERFSRAHPDALAIQADVTKSEARAAMLDAVAERFGRLDVLVNNAGTFVERDFASGADATQDLEQEVALNLTAPIQLTGEALRRWPAMAAIVFVTSGYALVSPTRAPTYGAVKAGLHGFAEGLRRQLAPQGTHVLELLPPLVDTPMTANTAGKKLSPAEVAVATLRALALRRPMALPGKTRLLPMMLRIAPDTIKRMVAGT